MNSKIHHHKAVSFKLIPEDSSPVSSKYTSKQRGGIINRLIQVNNIGGNVQADPDNLDSMDEVVSPLNHRLQRYTAMGISKRSPMRVQGD